MSNNQVSDEEEHVSFISAAVNRWKGRAYFKPAQNLQLKDTRSPKTDPPIAETHFSLWEHFMLPQSTRDYLARGFKVMREIKLMMELLDGTCFRVRNAHFWCIKHVWDMEWAQLNCWFQVPGPIWPFYHINLDHIWWLAYILLPIIRGNEATNFALPASSFVKFFFFIYIFTDSGQKGAYVRFYFFFDGVLMRSPGQLFFFPLTFLLISCVCISLHHWTLVTNRKNIWDPAH